MSHISIQLSYLEFQPTIQKFIHKHKIILHAFLIKLIKICLAQRPQSLEKLKHQSRIGIALGNRHQIYILMTRVTKGGASKGKDRRTNLGIRYNLDAKDVSQTWTTVWSEGAKD